MFVACGPFVARPGSVEPALTAPEAVAICRITAVDLARPGLSPAAIAKIIPRIFRIMAFGICLREVPARRSGSLPDAGRDLVRRSIAQHGAVSGGQ